MGFVLRESDAIRKIKSLDGIEERENKVIVEGSVVQDEFPFSEWYK